MTHRLVEWHIEYVAPGSSSGTIKDMADRLVQNCPHLEASGGIPSVGFWCPDCGSWLDVDRISQWVKEAEKSRDEAYPIVEGDEFGKILREERQREVYRRRRVMYELRNASALAVRPEMVLVLYGERTKSYGCRIFYREPRPVSCIERLDVEARTDVMLGLATNRDPVIRLVAEKVEEFHRLRLKLLEMGDHAPPRRVLYASDL